MTHTVAVARRSHPVPSFDHVGQAKPAKADLPPRTTAAFPLGEAIWEVLVKGHGSVKAAAFTMGDRDRSLLRREVISGELTIKQLFEADEQALATFGEFLIEHFGHRTKSKTQIAREKLPELLAVILEAVAEQEEK